VGRNNNKLETENTTMEDMRTVTEMRVADVVIARNIKSIFEVVSISGDDVKMVVVKSAKNWSNTVGKTFTIKAAGAVHAVNSGAWWLTFRRFTVN
jgi:hypothetical protein